MAVAKETVGKAEAVPYIRRVNRARVYRRRRMGALAATVVAAALAGALHAGSGASAESPAIPHTVIAGETLWAIATDHYPPSEDPRVAVEEIRDANGLEGYRIQPGTRLVLPAEL